MSHKKRKNNNVVRQSAYDISPMTHNTRLKSGQTEFLSERSAVKNKSKIGKGEAITVPRILPTLDSLIKGWKDSWAEKLAS